MDAHFNEYLAAIAGMHDIYGDAGDDHRSEFHEPADAAVAVGVFEVRAVSGASSGVSFGSSLGSSLGSL
jgi:hypothetical protein